MSAIPDAESGSARFQLVIGIEGKGRLDSLIVGFENINDHAEDGRLVSPSTQAVCSALEYVANDFFGAMDSEAIIDFVCDSLVRPFFCEA